MHHSREALRNIVHGRDRTRGCKSGSGAEGWKVYVPIETNEKLASF